MKTLLVVTEARFLKAPDGSIWTETVADYSFWERYFEYFSKVAVISRLKDVNRVEPSWKRVDGPKAEIIGFPYYVGPVEMLKQAANIRKFIADLGLNFDYVVMRVPSFISTLLWRQLQKSGKPIALEIVGDPWESLSPGTVRSIVRPFVRVYLTSELKHQSKSADAVSYVTSKTLQQRYPSTKFTRSYSSIDLPESFLLKEPRKFNPSGTIKLINVASMETLYKGHLTQIRALKELIELGYDCTLTLIGDGRCRKRFEKEAESLGIREKIAFLGSLPGKEYIKSHLDSSDLFIFPSLVEGLPRAVIEAMARGLPVIASNVGGIPELLEKEYLVKKTDVKGLVSKVVKTIENPNDLEKMSRKNLEIARNYVESEISKYRNEFYKYISSLN